MNETTIATQGDRFDSIFAKHYGGLNQDDYANGYNAFVLANIHLIDTPIFKGGEIVYLPYLDEVKKDETILGIWE